MSVKLRITGDNSGAMKALGQVNSKVSGLSSNLNGSLKGAIAGALSAAAIGAAVKSTLDMGDSLDKASQNLGVTTEYVQILQRVARDTGKDFNVLEKALINVNDAAEDALSGNKAKKDAFALLGISEEDLKKLNKKDLLTKAAQGAQQLPRDRAESAFSSIFGKKEAGMLLGVSGALADPEGVKQTMISDGQLISDEDITKMAEMQDAFEDLAATPKVSLAPALTWLFDAIASFFRGTVQLIQLLGTALGAFSTIITEFDMVGLMTSFAENFTDLIKTAVKNSLLFLINPLQGTVETLMSDASVKVLKGAFGDSNVDAALKTIEDQLLDFAKEDLQAEAAKQARRDARKEEQKALDGNVNRTGKEKDAKESKFTQSELKSNPSSYLSIGGLMGVNTQYRIERINKDMLEVLKKIHTTLQNQNPQEDSGF